MTVKKILTINKHDKVLHTRSEPVKKINRDVKQLIEDIRDTIEANPAVGLAAPQIGVLKRVMGVRLSYEATQDKEQMAPPLILVNPEIVTQGEDTEEAEEGCLSIPGMVGLVERRLKLTVRYQDEKGKWQERALDGWDARVVQHEIDHLDGILYLERLKSLDDLFVLVRNEEGHLESVPYLQVKQAASSAGQPPAPAVRPAREDKRSITQPRKP
jgi:peptide deformylase